MCCRITIPKKAGDRTQESAIRTSLRADANRQPSPLRQRIPMSTLPLELCGFDAVLYTFGAQKSSPLCRGNSSVSTAVPRRVPPGRLSSGGHSRPVIDSMGSPEDCGGRPHLDFNSSILPADTPARCIPKPPAESAVSRRGRYARHCARTGTGNDSPWRPEPSPYSHSPGPSRDSYRG